MRYPNPEDYVKAVQHRESFTTDELRRMELVLHPLYQIPMPAAGTSAVVFKAVADGQAHALRFFTRDDTWSGERYGALQEHFTARDIVSSVAMSAWVNDGIRVNGQTWPVLRMQWVNGHTLNKYVDDLIVRHDLRALGSLAAAWLELVVRIQRAEFAHGDLQHGNVLVDDRGAIRLVDFDCSWIASFAGQTAPSESGHRNYQLETRPWGRWMDTFSGLVIYLSLLALSKNPNPWHALNTGENLLFRQDDFRPPFTTPTWAHLSSIRDRELDQLADRLKECCTPGWVAQGGLDEILAPRAIPWWERTQVAAAASTGAGAQASAPSGAPPLPPPVPEQWPSHQQPTARPAGQPTNDWWKNTPGQGPRRGSRKAGRVVAVGLGLGFVVAFLSAMVIAAAGGPGATGLIMGPIVAAVAIIVGLAKRE